MRIGVFGGTFNPVHNGHLRLANAYTAALHLERLLVIPTHIPPHKPNRELAEGRHRLAMCSLAFADFPGAVVSDIELSRAEKSYTVDTLEQLKKQFPEAVFYLLMGSDMFLTLTEWRDWEHLSTLAVMCAGARDAGALDDLTEQRRRLEKQGARCELVELQPLPVSSTMVREQIRTGGKIRGMVPPAVADYIEKNGLYRNTHQAFL